MQATKADAYWQLMRMDKPIGTLLLLWPTLWALFLAANGLPDLKILVIFVLGVIVMRAAGCVINDYADRHLDGHVQRTRYRPIPSGKVTSKQALGLFGVLVACAFGLVLMLNTLTAQLACVAALFATVYPFTKRFIQLPQVVLGMAFSMAIPMAFAAQSEQVPPIAWLLFVANLCWTVAYDTLYAMVDRNDDLKIGIKSSAILFGRFDKMIIGGLQITTLLILILVGYLVHLSPPYFVGVLIAAILFVYQQWLTRTRERDACFQAFLNNNYVGLVIFVGIALSIVF